MRLISLGVLLPSALHGGPLWRRIPPQSRLRAVDNKGPAYGSASYWDERYTLLDSEDTVDWLFALPDVKGLLTEELMPSRTANILVVGCGNAGLSQQLYECGYTGITNIDLSEPLIASMAAQQPHMQWIIGDVTDMRSVATSSFDYVLDKSCYDALICSKEPQRRPAGGATHTAQSASSTAVTKMQQECLRVLRPGGRYIVFTLRDLETLHASFAGISGDPDSAPAPAADSVQASFYRVHIASRSTSHSLMVADKGPVGSSHPLPLRGVMSGRYLYLANGRFRAFTLQSRAKTQAKE